MTRIALLVLVSVVLTLSLCSCGSKSRPRSTSIRSIVEAFRVVPSSAERQYVGQLVSVPVRFGSSTVNHDDDRVVVSVVDDRPHCVEFRLRAPLGVIGPGSRSLVGTVKSCSTDGVDRGMGISFLILIEDCRLE